MLKKYILETIFYFLGHNWRECLFLHVVLTLFWPKCLIYVLVSLFHLINYFFHNLNQLLYDKTNFGTVKHNCWLLGHRVSRNTRETRCCKHAWRLRIYNTPVGPVTVTSTCVSQCRMCQIISNLVSLSLLSTDKWLRENKLTVMAATSCTAAPPPLHEECLSSSRQLRENILEDNMLIALYTWCKT